MKAATVGLACLLVSAGCATLKPPLMVDGAEIRNLTNGAITEVVVLHEPTMKAGKVNRILPHHTFSVGVAEQPLLGEKVTISWIDGSGQSRLAHGTLPRNSQAAGEDEVQQLIYEIHPGGRVAVRLESSP